MRRRPVVSVLALAALLVAAAAPASAQSIWLDRSVPKSIHLELAKPLLEGDGDGFFTFNTYLSTRLPLGENLSFVGELPVATLAIESDFDDESSTAFGNVYLGIESNVRGESGGWFEAGVRLPTASDDEFAVFTGVLGDLDRWEAFFPNAMFIHGAAHWRKVPRAGGVGADFRLAPQVWFPTEDEGETELFATYGAQVLFQSTGARGGAGLTGRWFVTDDDEGDASSHQVEAAFDFLSGSVRPGVTFRVPLEDDVLFFESPDATIGVTLNFILN